MTARNDDAPAPAPGGPAHRSTLEALQAERRHLVLEPTLTIGGDAEEGLHRKLDASREARITWMQERLARAEGHGTAAFTLGALHDVARASFERER